MALTSRRPSAVSKRFTVATADPFRAGGISVQLSSRRSAKPPKPRYSKLRIGVVICLCIFISSHVAWSKHVSAEATAAHQAQLEAVAEADQKATLFSQTVASLIAAHPELTLSISTVSSTNGLQQYGDTSTFDGASTGKLLTAADYLNHVERGTASLNQDIDNQSAEYLLNIMLVKSDDVAWQELNDYLGHADLAHYAAKIGMTSYDPDANTFSSSDVARLLHQLYAHQLLDAANRSLMLGYLQEANYRDYIVSAVPAMDTVYHKVGIDGDNVHDSAIITSGGKSIVVVIFTNGNGTYDWVTRAQLMQAITKAALTAYL